MGRTWVLVASVLLALPGMAAAEASRWELVQVDHLAHDESGNSTDFSVQVRSREGGLSLAYTGVEDGTVVRDVGLDSTWQPPPRQVRPGASWQPAFRSTITRNFAAGDRGNSFEVRLAASVCLQDVDKIYHYPADFDGRLETGNRSTNRRDDRPLVFPDPDRVLDLRGKPTGQLPLAVPAREDRIPLQKGEIYLVIQIEAYATANAGSGRDVYRHFYRYLRGDEGRMAGDLTLAARHSQGGTVAGLRFAVRNLGTNQTVEITTDEQGRARQRFEGVPGEDRVRLRVESVEVLPATRYALLLEPAAASWISGHLPVRAPLRQDVEMRRESPMAIVEYLLPLSRVGVLALRWSEAASRWEPIRAAVAVRDGAGEVRLRVQPEAFTERGGKPGLDLFIPGPAFLGTKRAGLQGYDLQQKLTDLKFLALPPPPGPTLVTLHLCDLATRIARLRLDVRDYFRKVLGEAAARRIAEVRLQFDPAAATPRYLDGVLYLPPGLDLTTDEGAEALMHEWGHHVAAVLADDPGVEGQLGGKHDVWTLARNPELAWDEGRAHFYSVLLTRGLDLPRGADSFGPGSARGALAEHERAGDQVEGVVTAALVQLYAEAGLRRTQDVLKEFQAANDQAVARTGHPPRTSREFLDAVSGLVAEREQAGRLSPAQAEAWRRRIGELRRSHEISG
jgi:hypothetical protein